jgi:chaperonin cofactor prefoldin
MNSKETYAQFVVDEMACTNDLKSTNVKNAFNIIDVAGKLDELKGRIKSFATQRERLAERGTTMDALNESKFASQDRPETYNILYIIYKPNERKSKLDDDIRMLIPECDKYGFLPVFICEKDTWEGGIQEKESIYKEIKSLANDSIVIYNGNTYSIAI